MLVKSNCRHDARATACGAKHRRTLEAAASDLRVAVPVPDRVSSVQHNPRVPHITLTQRSERIPSICMPLHGHAFHCKRATRYLYLLLFERDVAEARLCIVGTLASLVKRAAAQAPS
jgi:hypothetical protein